MNCFSKVVFLTEANEWDFLRRAERPRVARLEGPGIDHWQTPQQTIVTHQRLSPRTFQMSKGEFLGEGRAGRHSQHARPLRLAILIYVIADNSY